MRHCCYFREKWGLEGLNALPKVRQENLWVEQEMEVAPIRLLRRIKNSIEREDFFTWLCYRHPFSERWIPHYHDYSQSCKVYFALALFPFLVTSKATHYLNLDFSLNCFQDPGPRESLESTEVILAGHCQPYIPQLFNYLCESEAVTFFVFWSVELVPGMSIFACLLLLYFQEIILLNSSIIS